MDVRWYIGIWADWVNMFPRRGKHLGRKRKEKGRKSRKKGHKKVKREAKTALKGADKTAFKEAS